MDDSWREIGRVRSVNPRARELRVAIRASFGHAYVGLGWIRFLQPSGGALRCKIARIRCEESVAVVVLGAGVSRDAVGGLKGASVVMTAEEIPPKPGAGMRLTDLMGMKVVAPQGEVLGTVCEVFEGPANDAFAVARADGSRFLLPAIKAVLVSVDSENGTINTGDVTPFAVDA